MDSSKIGYPMYKRCGFTKDVGEIVVDMDEYGGNGIGVHRWVALLREPQTEQIEQ